MSSRYYIYDSYTDSVAEFGMGKEMIGKAVERVGKTVKGTRASLTKAKNVGANALGYARRGRMGAAGATVRNYMTKADGKLNLKRAAIAAGALGTGIGATAAGAYKGKRAYDKSQKERGSLKGRIKRLLGR